MNHDVIDHDDPVGAPVVGGGELTKKGNALTEKGSQLTKEGNHLTKK